MGDVFRKFVEISPLTWLFLELVFIGVFFVTFLPFWWIIVIYVIIGWVFLGFMALFAMQLNRIKLKLIPRLNVHKKNINEMSSLLSPNNFEIPEFLKLRLQRRSSLGRLLFGQPANKQELLFLGNTKGPSILVFGIRLIMILSAIYLSTSLFLLAT